MDPTSHLAHSLSERTYARMLLGAEHPLTRVLDRLALLAKHLLVVGALLVVAIGAMIASIPHALPCALAAACVRAGLAAAEALLGLHKKQLVLDLVIEGPSQPPLGRGGSPRGPPPRRADAGRPYRTLCLPLGGGADRP